LKENNKLFENASDTSCTRWGKNEFVEGIRAIKKTKIRLTGA